MTAKIYVLLAKRDQLETASCAFLGSTKHHLDLTSAVLAVTGPGAKAGLIHVRAMLGLREQMAVLVRAVYQVNTRKGKAMPIARNADLESIRLMQQLPTRICARTAQKEAIFQPPETQHLWTVLHAMQEHILIKSA
jgi:hypothetical protein